MADEAEALEQRGDALFRRLGYYGFMAVVGLAMPLSSTIGTVIFVYGSVRFVIVAVQFSVVVRRAIRAPPP
jgi:hypothetical protein